MTLLAFPSFPSLPIFPALTSQSPSPPWARCVTSSFFLRFNTSSLSLRESTSYGLYIRSRTNLHVSTTKLSFSLFHFRSHLSEASASSWPEIPQYVSFSYPRIMLISLELAFGGLTRILLLGIISYLCKIRRSSSWLGNSRRVSFLFLCFFRIRRCGNSYGVARWVSELFLWVCIVPSFRQKQRYKWR